MQAADEIGLETALARAQLYDTAVQHGAGDDPDGLGGLIAGTNGLVGEPADAGERVWLDSYFDVHIAVLIDPSDPETAHAWRESTDRFECMRRIAETGNVEPTDRSPSPSTATSSPSSDCGAAPPGTGPLRSGYCFAVTPPAVPRWSVPEVVFDERIAASYDSDSAAMFDLAVVEPIVDVLAGLAGDGAALELGIGTGRIALPLSRRGVTVHGIDESAPMVERLRGKPGADRIGITIGDFATARVDARFTVAYLVFNTIMNLTTQDAQVACFANAAAHLEAGGCFVVEVGVPELRRLPPGECVRAVTVSPTYVGLDEYTDLAAQICWSHHYRVVGDRLELFSAPFRYVWPAELDLMARLAGMTLRHRWAGWSGEPFTGVSTSHVSIWEKTASLGAPPARA